MTFKCPKCKGVLDASGVGAGSSVRCEECCVMVRVPAGGKTGKIAPRSRGRRRRGRGGRAGGGSGGGGRVGGGGGGNRPKKLVARQSQLFAKMNRSKAQQGPPPSALVGDRGGAASKSGMSGGVIAIIGLGVIGLIALVVVLATGGSKKPKWDASAEEEHSDPAYSEGNTGGSYSEPQPAPPPAPARPAPRAKKKPTLRKSSSGRYDIPATFEKNAGLSDQARRSKKPSELGVDAGLISQAKAKLSRGDFRSLLAEDYTYTGPVICNMLSNEESVARSAFQYMLRLCSKRGMLLQSGKNPIEMEYFNLAQWRGGGYQQWSEWFEKSRNQIADWKNAGKPGKVKIRAQNPASADWDKLMRDLRVGGGYDEMDRPEGLAFARVQAMGKKAFPYIARYLDHQDSGLGSGANAVLNELTGRSVRWHALDKHSIKKEWEAWIGRN